MRSPISASIRSYSRCTSQRSTCRSSSRTRNVDLWIDVAANDIAADFKRLTKGGAGAHERVQHRRGVTVLLIEGRPFIIAWLNGMDDVRTENRTQPLSPPLVQAVNRSINLLAPALFLRKAADLDVRVCHCPTASLTSVAGWDFRRQALNLCSVPAEGLGSVPIRMSLL